MTDTLNDSCRLDRRRAQSENKPGQRWVYSANGIRTRHQLNTQTIGTSLRRERGAPEEKPGGDRIFTT
jgi:hypothetical protein